MRAAKAIFFAVATVLFFSGSAEAQVAVEGGSGMIFLNNARTLGAGAVGVGLTYSGERSWIGDQPTNDTTLYASVTAGLADTLELSVSAPWRSVSPENGDAESGVGDGVARVKWNFFTDEKYNIRLAAIGSLTLPTGDENKGFGAGQAFPGLTLALSKEYEVIVWTFSLGHVLADKAERALDPYTAYGAGIEWFPLHPDLALLAETTGRVWSKRLAGRDDDTSYNFGARYYLSDNASAQASYGAWGGGSSASYRYMVGVTVGLGLSRKATAAKTVVPSDAGRTESTTGPEPVVIVLDPVYFAFDKSDLTAESRAVLDADIARIVEHPTASFVIEGHCDSTGTVAYNRKLGERRAGSVRRYLIENGVSPERLTPISFGEERPAADNGTKEGRAKNRRVEFVIQGK